MKTITEIVKAAYQIRQDVIKNIQPECGGASKDMIDRIKFDMYQAACKGEPTLYFSRSILPETLVSKIDFFMAELRVQGLTVDTMSPSGDYIISGWMVDGD
jgi:hypothetical protein